jgi:hypothetical protein
VNAIIPDTLEGALILSLIDFFLSFVVISFIGVVLAGFPLLNRAGARLSRPRPRLAHKGTVQARPAAQDQEIPIEHVAVITAAVASMLGPHRIVRIGHAGRTTGWTAEGRQVQHLAHAPPRRP